MGSERYSRNHNAFSEEEQVLLAQKRLLVAGCGGLGGYVVEFLGRLGVGYLRVVDGDVFEESNLNRQLLSSGMNLGRPKVLAAQQRMLAINPQVEVEGLQMFFTEDNALELLQGCDLAVDALDNIPARRLIQRAARESGIPLVHGAIAGWAGQVCVIRPGENWLDLLYGDPKAEQGEELEAGNLSFTTGVVAALQAAEAVKLLLGKVGLQGELLQVDLLNGTFERIALGPK
ncbi:MAG: ThiF family adenylyltransferase [Anaerolineaceae bacterium]